MRGSIIHFDHNPYDDNTESVPGVNFLGGHVTDVPGPDSEPYIKLEAYERAIEALKCVVAHDYGAADVFHTMRNTVDRVLSLDAGFGKRIDSAQKYNEEET